MRWMTLLLVSFLVAACATPPDSSQISRVGLLADITDKAKDTYIGVTVFENEFNEVELDWSFPQLALDELQSQIAAGGREAIDLSQMAEVRQLGGSLFETGYLPEYGFGDHSLLPDAAKTLGDVAAEQNLDIILVLRPTEGNIDTPYGQREPEGGFGVHRTGGILRKDRAYTYVQLEARVLSGSPPELVYLAPGTNMVEWPAGNETTDTKDPAFRRAMEDQVSAMAERMLSQLKF